MSAAASDDTVSPIAGPRGNTDDSKKSSKLTAGQIKLRERTRRLAGKKPSTSTPKKKPGARRTKAKNETPSSSAAKEEPIQKGKNYRTRANRELKEKDPESEEVKNKKFVTDTKDGARSKDGEFLFFFSKILQYFFR